MIGQIINCRYEVLEKIGDGALFSVFKARDKVLNRLVALKLPTKEVSENSNFLSSIYIGYQESAKLLHPNIMKMMDSGYESDTFIATEYLRGTNVKERIRRAGALSVSTALEIIIPVISALEYAHSNEVVHGDLRPEDIIVGSDGEIKVTDFGLSHALCQCPEVADRFVMRSIQYQAPEMSEGAAPTTSCDIYSAGAILYEMLTGTVPFEGSSSVAIAVKKSKESPTAPRHINSAVPRSLSDIVMMALERNPEVRYQSISAMLADLITMRDALRLGKPVIIQHQPHIQEQSEVNDEVQEESFKKRFIWLTVIFVFVVIAFLFGTMFFKIGRNKVETPDLRGKTFEEAQSVVDELGLIIVDNGRAYSDIYKSGTICVQEPGPIQSVARGTEIKIKISEGTQNVEVPDLIGLTESDARSAAAEKSFLIGKIKQQYSDNIPAGSVIAQDPQAKLTREPASQIDLILSQGPKPLPEPTSPPSTVDDESFSERVYNVDVEVPDSAVNAQEVRVVVKDDNGENEVYNESHEPGDKFRIPVTVLGKNADIKVYIDDKLVIKQRY